MALWLTGGALMVLLIACANVAVLVALRAVARRLEIVIRIQLGATAQRIFALLFIADAGLSARLPGQQSRGLVVAAIRTTPTGVTEAVAILQSPDAETGRAVRDALLQWTFRPQFGMGGEGLVVFYFRPTGRDGVVLSPAEMREVTSPGAKNVKREDEPRAKHITEEDFWALSTRPSTLLLDIRDRETFGEGHEKGAVNIPFEELLTRGPAEIPVSRHVVIDCRDPLDYCAMAVHWLASYGFTQLSILRR